jgi:hypothetical protein
MQVVTITFFRLSGLKNKLWAMAQMQLGSKKIQNTAGLTFYKLLGSGSGDGFAWYPDFSVYALLCVWKNEDNASNYFQYNRFYKTYCEKSVEHYTLYLHAIEAHGLWSGINPFEKVVAGSDDKPIVVLTRATIKPNKLWAFWKKVSGVSHSIEKYRGKLFSKGVGEWPIVQQATISVWSRPEYMKAYAYQNPLHKEVIKLTKEMGWYKEELFARFAPFKEQGIWNGNKILKDYLKP